ncbi:IS982 family transposase, partial [Pedobacter sp. JCM 36344]
MSNLIRKYELILKTFREISLIDNFYYKPVKPKLSDLELITLSVVAESSGIDSEYQLFRELRFSKLEGMIERSVYNRRKRKLFPYIEVLRKKLAARLNDGKKYFIVDSMPLEICKNARITRSKICKDQEGAFPNQGFCASQNARYYGYKLHAVCSADGVFENFDLSPA